MPYRWRHKRLFQVVCRPIEVRQPFMIRSSGLSRKKDLSMVGVLALSRRQFGRLATALMASVLGVVRLGAAEPRGAGTKKIAYAAHTRPGLERIDGR